MSKRVYKQGDLVWYCDYSRDAKIVRAIIVDVIAIDYHVADPATNKNKNQGVFGSTPFDWNVAQDYQIFYSTKNTNALALPKQKNKVTKNYYYNILFDEKVQFVSAAEVWKRKTKIESQEAYKLLGLLKYQTFSYHTSKTLKYTFNISTTGTLPGEEPK